MSHFDNGQTFERLSKLTGVPLSTLSHWARAYKIPADAPDPDMILRDIKAWRKAGWAASSIKKEIKRLYGKKAPAKRKSEPTKIAAAPLKASYALAIETILESPVLDGKEAEKKNLRKLLERFMKGDE